ncbi:SDR family oxidoreductase [Streptomyces minutiscleroticus]|uniref:Short-chain dehydrogenase/reductase n=1 Tax=Streptomyces minutiscleroticus TaxID=68238 RepID=A0A918U329_9ACTN|nr:SDR family oxidoreductase [Streptomyces minutiscleroticus]GGX84449.1 short-chain dehydrogenase/reductase [Streptomyces minutiscleroticus]
MATVLITGCSSGIGLEAALSFARRGYQVCASMRDPARAGALLDRARGEGLDVEVPALDVTDDASVAAAVAAVESRYGGVDVLVNNAGVDCTGAVEATPLQQARAVMETNYWGALRTVRAVLPGMRSRGNGVIVNVSSLAARTRAVPHGGFYASSKAALGVVSEALSAEVAPFGVRVVCLEPGSYASRIHDNATVRQPSQDDPYAADEAWMKTFLSRAGEGAGDCREAAEAIVAAAEDPATPLHTVVGPGAEAAVEFARGAGYEEWLPLFLQQAEALAGPRPAAP